MEALFSEKVGIKNGLLADLDGSQTTARIGLQKGHKVAIVINVASAAVNLDFTLKQSDAASAGNTKDLVANNPYFLKLAANSSFTKVAAPAAANVVVASLNGSAGVMVVEVLAEELDRDNGYGWVHVVFADPATARLASCVYLLDAKNLPAYSESL